MVLRTRFYHLQAVPKFLGVLNEAVFGGGGPANKGGVLKKIKIA